MGMFDCLAFWEYLFHLKSFIFTLKKEQKKGGKKLNKKEILVIKISGNCHYSVNVQMKKWGKNKLNKTIKLCWLRFQRNICLWAVTLAVIFSKNIDAL